MSTSKMYGATKLAIMKTHGDANTFIEGAFNGLLVITSTGR